MKTIILSLVIWFIGFSDLMAQGVTPLVEIERNIYSNSTQFGKLHELEDIFSDPDDLSQSFIQFNNVRKTQRALNHIGLGMTGVGILGAAILRGQAESASPTQEEFLVDAVMVLSGPVFIILNNAIVGTIKVKKKNMLINRYNQQVKSQSDLSIELGLTKHGLGLMVRF